jgi:hypothetical protein
MPAMSKPAPGSPAAVLDTVVRSVAEGRYRYAQLLLLWHRDRVPPEDMAELVTGATEVPALPPGLTASEVIERAKPAMLPEWLAHHIDTEIARIFAGQPVSGSAPLQLVARVVAAVCIDVSVDTIDAAQRAEEPDAAPTDAAARNRLIHLGVPDTIHLASGELTDSGPRLPPPSR